MKPNVARAAVATVAVAALGCLLLILRSQDSLRALGWPEAVALRAVKAAELPRAGAAASRRPQLSNASVDGRSCCVTSPTEGTACVIPGVALAFRENSLCERGTTLSTFDYADAWELLACGVSYVSTMGVSCPEGATSLPRFQARFPERVVVTNDAHWGGMDEYLAARSIRGLYQQMAGASWATTVWPTCATRMMVHAVFDAKDPHGDAYAAISSTLQRGNGTDYVQYIVARPPPGVDAAGLRPALGIPLKGSAGDDAVVWCRHGGYGTMSLALARAALCEHMQREATNPSRPWFLLLNTEPLACEADVAAYGRTRYLPPTISRTEVFTFLATCDACLHARMDGESFGLAVAECTRAGLPVLTSGVRVNDGDHHLNALGELALLYHDGEQLIRRLRESGPAARDGWRAQADAYRALYASSLPEAAMVRFIRVYEPDSAVRKKRKGCDAGAGAG